MPIKVFEYRLNALKNRSELAVILPVNGSYLDNYTEGTTSTGTLFRTHDSCNKFGDSERNSNISNQCEII
jgi:hypothetical protein